MKRSDFAGNLRGQKVDLFTLKNANGLTASITNYGARLVELLVPDRHQNFDNVIVGHSSMADFLNNNEYYFGSIVGRCANRIANGKFKLNGKQYQLETNSNEHHLHGGSQGFHRVVWGANQVDDRTLNLSYRSENGEQGYPGNLGISVTYQLSDENELHINFRAEADDDTIINVTNHAYFNFCGIKNGASIDGHLLFINADRFTPVDKTLIPTGEFASVADTPFDFRTPKPIGQVRDRNHPQLKYSGGYDHNFVLNKQKEEKLSHAAIVREPGTGRQMDLFTTEPGLQFYVLNNPVAGIDSSFCLETQHFPDSPNQPNFPSITLDAFKTFESKTIYRFSSYAVEEK